MRRLILALIVLSTTLPFFAQSKFTIRGRVVDALMRNELPGATVELLSGKDSSVISSIVANVQSYNDMKGMYNSSVFSFEVPRVKGDSYIIRASYIGFEIGYVNVSLADLNRREFERTIPDITLKRDTKVLDELEVVGTKVKFYYKGDTVVYNADAFVLAEGSMLDGLVRQLPGMKFGKDGNIYHNGKLVENLLLNGKEFFKGDNQIMLDMLPAYTVKNIRMYDKYGHKSELLGQKLQDDKLYVMDVVLKREYSVGWMANAEAGGGTSDRYLGQLFAMRHTDHSRISLYGAINNLNDKRKPGQDTNWSPDQLSPGQSKEIHGGIDYYVGDREGKYELSGNAQVAHSDFDLEENTDKVNFLPTNDTYEYIRSLSHNKSLSINTSHQFYFKWDKANLTINPILNYNKYENVNNTLNGIFNEQQTGMNRNILENLYSPTVSDDIRRAAVYRYRTESLGKGHTVNGSISATSIIKINNFGDHISFNASASGGNKHEDLFNRYGTLYGANGAAGPSGYQYFKNRPDKNFNFSLGASYGYKMNNHLSLSINFNYERKYKNQHSSLYLLDKLVGYNDSEIGMLPSLAEYEQTFDPRNSFIAKSTDNIYTIYPGVSWNCKNSKGTSFYFQSNVGISPTRQSLNYLRGSVDTAIVRNSLQVMTPFTIFTISNAKHHARLQLVFRLQSKTPDLVNMVNMTDDTDPLNITIGNPDLKNEQNYSFNLMMSKSNPGSQFTHSIRANYVLVKNALSMGYTYNPDTGIRMYCADNVNGNWLANAAYTLSMPLDKAKRMTLNTSPQIEYANSVDLIGESTTETFCATRSSVRTLTLKEDLSLAYQIGKSQVGLKGSYAWRRINGASVNFNDFNAMDFNYGATAMISLPWNCQLSTDITMYSRRGYTGSSMNTDDLVWNARLSHIALKGKLTIILDAFDILNQINNVTRVVNAQGRVETFTNALPRYAMLHMAYKLNIAPKNK